MTLLSPFQKLFFLSQAQKLRRPNPVTEPTHRQPFSLADLRDRLRTEGVVALVAKLFQHSACSTLKAKMRYDSNRFAVVRTLAAALIADGISLPERASASSEYGLRRD